MELPMRVEFSAAYLDGVMEHEPAEIAKQWKVIREHLAESVLAADALQAADYLICQYRKVQDAKVVRDIPEAIAAYLSTRNRLSS